MANTKKTSDNTYFDLFGECAGYACEAAEALADMAENFTDLEPKMQRIHEIENKADKCQHVLLDALNRAFITPIEREDILALARAIDDVIDALDDVSCRFYMYNVQIPRAEAKAFIALFVKSAHFLREAVAEFRNYKKSKTLHGLIVELNHCEEEGDRLYRKSVHDLFKTATDPIDTIRWLNIYEISETCCDLFEDVADIMSTVVMKNS